MFKEEHMEKIKLYQLRNSSGFGVDVSNLGGTVVSLYTPDRDGNILDVALGFDELSDYLDNPFYFGTTVTRVAGRLAGASIDIAGRSYKLPANDNGNTLHGGGSCRYDFFRVSKLDPATLSLRYDYPALECGFPGNLDCICRAVSGFVGRGDYICSFVCDCIHSSLIGNDCSTVYSH